MEIHSSTTANGLPHLSWVQVEPVTMPADITILLKVCLSSGLLIGLIIGASVGGILGALVVGTIGIFIGAVIAGGIIGLFYFHKKFPRSDLYPENVTAYAYVAVADDGETLSLFRNPGRVFGNAEARTTLKEITGFSIDTAEHWFGYKAVPAHVLLANLQDGTAHAVAFHTGGLDEINNLRARTSAAFGGVQVQSTTPVRRYDDDDVV